MPPNNERYLSERVSVLEEQMSTVRDTQERQEQKLDAMKNDVNKITWAAAAGLAILQFLAPVILKLFGVH